MQTKSVMSTEHVRVLSPTLLEPSLWGYKTRNLALLLGAGFPVPKGVAIGVEWFREYKKLREETNSTQIDILLNLLQSLASETLRQLYLSGSLLARSSATTEGSPTISSAGVFESIRIDEPPNIRHGVQRVWDCLFLPEVRKYLLMSGLPEAGLGVLLQELIAGSWSGILHTSNAATSDHRNILLEFEEWRLGAVVDGAKTPYAMALDKSSGSTRPLGEPSEAQLPIRDLWILALRAEALFGRPVELEWVIDKAGNLWFVQARPLSERQQW